MTEYPLSIQGCLCFKNLNILSCSTKEGGVLQVYRKMPPTEILQQKLSELPTTQVLNDLVDNREHSLLFGTNGKSIQVFTIELESGTLQQVSSQEIHHPITTISTSRQGSLLGVGDSAGGLALFTIAKDGSLIKALSVQDHTARISKIDFHYDGQIVGTASQDKSFCIYNIKGSNLEKVKQIQSEAELPYSFLSFTLDDKLVAVEEGEQSVLSVWELGGGITKEKTVVLQGGAITQGKVSEEGLYLGLGTGQGRCSIINLRYFDLESKQLCHKGRVNDLSFTNDSRFMLSVSDKGSYHFLSLMKQEGLFAKASKVWLVSLLVVYWVLVILQWLGVY